MKVPFHHNEDHPSKSDPSRRQSKLNPLQQPWYCKNEACIVIPKNAIARAYYLPLHIMPLTQTSIFNIFSDCMQYVKYSEMTNSGPLPRVSKLIADDLRSVIVCHIITHCTPFTIVKHFHTSLINGRSTHQTNWGHTLSAYNFDEKNL